jgi:hypothetical protein
LEQSVDHDGVVGAEAVDEPVQVGQVVGLDGGHPRVELFTAAFGEDLRERGDPDRGVAFGAGGAELLGSDLVVAASGTMAEATGSRCRLPG